VVYNISFGPNLKVALAQVKCPQLWFVAKNDQVKPGDASELAVRDGAKQPITVHLFEAQSHGWVNRGDVTKEHVAADTERALSMACDFLKQQLA
jgi:dienelactone hydrolase